jgi:hypothetical protein
VALPPSVAGRPRRRIQLRQFDTLVCSGLAKTTRQVKFFLASPARRRPHPPTRWCRTRESSICLRNSLGPVQPISLPSSLLAVAASCSFHHRSSHACSKPFIWTHPRLAIFVFSDSFCQRFAVLGSSDTELAVEARKRPPSYYRLKLKVTVDAVERQSGYCTYSRQNIQKVRS